MLDLYLVMKKEPHVLKFSTSMWISGSMFDFKESFNRMYISNITHFFWHPGINDVSGIWLADDAEHVKTSNGFYIFRI